MISRKELYTALMCGGPHSPDRSERASRLIDNFAHELAEKIRERYVVGGVDTASVSYGANYIDPNPPCRCGKVELGHTGGAPGHEYDPLGDRTLYREN